jgi:hypothetical protein
VAWPVAPEPSSEIAAQRIAGTLRTLCKRAPGAAASDGENPTLGNLEFKEQNPTTKKGRKQHQKQNSRIESDAQFPTF